MKLSRKLISVLLAITMVLSIIPASVFATGGEEKGTLKFATMSDIHLFPQTLTPQREDFATDEEYEAARAKWLRACGMDSKEYDESEDILDTALETFKIRAQRDGIKYLLLPGDLSRYSEYEAHTTLAERMNRFEEETGIQVIAINGNHDINVSSAASFRTGEKEEARAITAQEFYEVYANLGYDLATDYYGIKDGKVQSVANALSYAVALDENTQLIVVDSGKYSFGEKEKGKTDGAVSDECLKWICDKADEGTKKGMTNLVMIHHSMAAHLECEPSVTFAFVLDDYLRVAETFADHNIHYTFTGHLHQTDIATVINDNGKVLYDCESGSLTSYPNTYREYVLTNYTDGTAKIDYDNVSFDAETAFTHNGVTYTHQEFLQKSFGMCYGGAFSQDGSASASGFAEGLIMGYAGGIFTGMAEQGVLNYIRDSFGFDLQQFLVDFLKPYIGNGIKLGSNSWLSADNIMWFVEDLCDQVTELYLKNPQNLLDELLPAIQKIVDLKMSDEEMSDRVKADTGLKGHDGYGTLEDVIFSAVYYFYTGNEPAFGEDKLIADACKTLENGITDCGLFDTLLDVVFNDILNDAILGKLEIRADKFFNSDYYSQKAAEGLNYLLKYFLRDDFTYLNLVNTIFGLGVLPWDSLYDVLDKLAIQEFWTDSQDESIGVTLAWFIKDFATDEEPQLRGDYDVSYANTDLAVPVTTANYRKPTMISATIGDNAETSAYIGWFSKYTLTKGDIVVKDGDKVVFSTVTGENEIGAQINDELVERYFPGIDLGITGFFKYYFNLNRHTVKLTGLKPGTTYTYYVGNADKGWWSDARTFTTSSGRDEDNLTFFHMSDPQSQSEAQYTRSWANTVKTAFSLYPDAKFIAATGDLVDNGMNTKMWQWMFDTACSTGEKDLGDTFLMPATGNHEGFDDYSTVSNFTLPNVPEQDTASGVYYSYDYNNLHVAVLNTNDLGSDDALSDEQIEWLKKDMTGTDAEWKIVMLHKALYSNGSHYDDDDVCAMREQLGALLPELGIDLVLQGHDHVYLRTASLVGNVKTNDEITYLSFNDKAYKTVVEPIGTVYEISGCSGVKIYRTKSVSETDELFPRADKIVDADRQMFSAIQIRDGILYFDAYLVSEDGSTQNVDSFAISHDRTQGEVLPEEEWPAEEGEETGSGIWAFLTKVLNVLTKLIKIISGFFGLYGEEIKNAIN